MKTVLLIICVLFINVLGAQNEPNSNLEKFTSVDSIVNKLYSVISGEAGESRNWDLMRQLFTLDAKLIPARRNGEGIVEATYLSCEDYIERSGSWLEKNGFFEYEINRVEETFGDMTHLFSTYASYKTKADKTPFMRGINSIQLMNDGVRYWIINIYWMGETAENPLPEKYLPD